MFEYEKKVMLTKNEYLSIIILMCKDTPIQTQTNYYFDDEELSMNEKGITCRIRAKNGKYKTTVKNHNAEHPDCSTEVELAVEREFNPQIFTTLGLNNQGKLVTDRVVLYKDSTCEMVLDRNAYLGYTDFELEIEYFKGSEKKAEHLLENIAEFFVARGQLLSGKELFVRIGQGNSKSKRFFDRLKNYK